VVPYASPLFRHLAKDPRVEILVAYCSLQGAERSLDPEFGVEVQWDEPLLDGYPWVDLSSQSKFPYVGSLFGLWNFSLWSVIRSGSFDAVVIYTGYMCAAFWQALLAAKSRGIPVVISSDSTVLQPRDQARWKRPIKPFILGSVYRSVGILMAASAAACQLALRLGMPQERIVVIRSGADKDAWIARAEKSDPIATRSSWSVPPDAQVVFSCGKLQPWKRPLDLLRAFAKADVAGAYLVFAGDGALRKALEVEAHRLNVQERVRLLGFVNVSQLPAFYKAADLFVLCSDYDQCPLVVPEAMFSGIPVILSDAVLGRLDMVHEGESGYSYPCGDVDALAAILRKVLSDPVLLDHLKAGVRRQMESWTMADCLDSWLSAIQLAQLNKPNPGGRAS
jgi:glycosyltransferase involved in cell wall biosynthesis